MTLLDSAVRRMTGQPSHSARLIPLASAIGDFAVLAVATMVAMIGRQELTWFDARDDIIGFVSAAAVPLLIGWLAMLLAVGAYSRDVFGAGTEEYKLLIKASVLSAALVGIGCYLTGFPLSRGFFLLVFLIGTPLLLLWRLAVPPRDPADPQPRSPPPGRDHRGQPEPRGRRRRGAAPRVLARLHRPRRPDHAGQPASSRRRPASPSSARPSTRSPRSRASAPT